MGRKFRLILAYLYILFHCPGHGLASSTVSQCRLFMAQAQKPKVEEKFLQNPSYFQSLDICEKVLSWQMPRLPPPTQVHRRKAISRPRASSTGLLSGHRKNYRRQIQEDQFDTECKIVFYTRSDFGGQHSTLRGSRRFIQEREKSLRTFGNCCWALFSQGGHRGKRHLVTGNQDLRISWEWGMRPGDVRSVGLNKKCLTRSS